MIVVWTALPALTRVTRLDSNFDPVPGSTVPRIAPTLLTYSPLPRHDEEVHVTLPPLKGSRSSSPVISRTHRHPQQPSPLDGGRRVPCRELGDADCQGWLFRRRQTRGFWSGPRWTRRFFVLKRHTLYGYRDPEVNESGSRIRIPIRVTSPHCRYFVLIAGPESGEFDLPARVQLRHCHRSQIQKICFQNFQSWQVQSLFYVHDCVCLLVRLTVNRFKDDIRCGWPSSLAPARLPSFVTLICWIGFQECGNPCRVDPFHRLGYLPSAIQIQQSRYNPLMVKWNGLASSFFSCTWWW